MAAISLGAPQPWPSPPQQPPLPTTPTTTNTNNKNYFFLQPPPLTNQQYPLIDPGSSSSNPNDADSDSDSSRSISPLMAALIAVLAAAFLCLFYYTVISRFCRRRRHRHTRRRILRSLDRVDPMVHDPARPDTGLDESYIRQIAVFKYHRGDGLIEATECAVCLADFKEEESLRLMPNCEHAFHLPCIDTWLATHSSCPLCRSGMNPLPARAAENGGSAAGAAGVNVSVAALRVERSDDAVAVVVVREVESRGQVVVEVVEDEIEKETG